MAGVSSDASVSDQLCCIISQVKNKIQEARVDVKYNLLVEVCLDFIPQQLHSPVHWTKSLESSQLSLPVILHIQSFRKYSWCFLLGLLTRTQLFKGSLQYSASHFHPCPQSGQLQQPLLYFYFTPLIHSLPCTYVASLDGNFPRIQGQGSSTAASFWQYLGKHFSHIPTPWAFVFSWDGSWTG